MKFESILPYFLSRACILFGLHCMERKHWNHCSNYHSKYFPFIYTEVCISKWNVTLWTYNMLLSTVHLVMTFSEEVVLLSVVCYIHQWSCCQGHLIFLSVSRITQTTLDQFDEVFWKAVSCPHPPLIRLLVIGQMSRSLIGQKHDFCSVFLTLERIDT